VERNDLPKHQTGHTKRRKKIAKKKGSTHDTNVSGERDHTQKMKKARGERNGRVFRTSNTCQTKNVGQKEGHRERGEKKTIEMTGPMTSGGGLKVNYGKGLKQEWGAWGGKKKKFVRRRMKKDQKKTEKKGQEGEWESLPKKYQGKIQGSN